MASVPAFALCPRVTPVARKQRLSHRSKIRQPATTSVRTSNDQGVVARTYQEEHEGNQDQADDEHAHQTPEQQTVAPASQVGAGSWGSLLHC